MSTRTLTTAKQFEEMADRLGPCELVRGEVMHMSPGGIRHSEIAARATLIIGQWARRTKRGRVLSCEAGVLAERDPDTVRGADAAYVSFERLARDADTSGYCAVPPELVVEVIGKGRSWLKMVEKAGEYLKMGVDRVWIIDPQTNRIHILRPDAEPAALSEEETLVDEAVLPGFSCPVSEFFAD